MIVPLLITVLIYGIFSNIDDQKTFINALPKLITAIEIVVFVIGAGFLAILLNVAGRKGTIHESRSVSNMPIYSTLCFTALMLTIHLGAWVPIELSALLSFPCIILPPLIYRVVHYSDKQNLLSPEETHQIQEAAKKLTLIEQFIERYPDYSAFVYQQKHNHSQSSGGLILFNHEPLPIPHPANIEVSLECPFTSTFGVIAEGKEKFSAVIARHENLNTSLVSLPINHWDNWKQGMTPKDWAENIAKLDQVVPIKNQHGPIPQTLNNNKIMWQPFKL